MIKPSIRLQDLRWGIYAKKKADSTGADGVGIGGTSPRRGTARPESTTSLIGHISLGEKPAGQPSAGNPHAGLEVAGAGNVAMGACVQIRLAGPASDKLVGGKSQKPPVARIAR